MSQKTPKHFIMWCTDVFVSINTYFKTVPNTLLKLSKVVKKICHILDVGIKQRKKA